MKPLPVALVVVALVLFGLAVLYLVGAIQFLTATGSGTHWKHALLLGILGVVALVGANFARNRAPA